MDQIRTFTSHGHRRLLKKVLVNHISGLRALGLSARVIDVLDREVEFILVPLWIAAVFATAVGQHAEQPNLVAVEEGDHAVVEEIGCRDRRLAIIEFRKRHFGVGVDERLLIDAANPLQVADIEGVLRAAVARDSLSNSPVSLLLGLAFSSATSWASVRTRPSSALLASSALSRLFMVSRS